MPYLIVFALIVLFIIFLSFFIVDEKTAVIIQRLGKFHSVASSGLNMKIPFLDVKAGSVNLKVQQLDVTVETKTKDNVFVYLQVSVQYQVVPQKVEFAFYSLENPHQQIASYIFDEVRAAVPKNDLDDVFEKKDDIAVAVKHNIAEQMSNYGFQIIKALITDINPDTKVKEAMNRINAARRDKIAALEEAEGHKIKVVKAAEAEAESKRLSGKGIAEQRLEIVHGFRTSIEEFQKNLNTVSHAEVMQFMLMTQYFDMLNNIGSNGKNSSIIVPHSPASLKEIQDQIVQGTIIGQEINRDTKHNV